MIVFPVSCTVRIQIEVWVGAPKGNTLTFIVYPYYSPFFSFFIPYCLYPTGARAPFLNYTQHSTAEHQRKDLGSRDRKRDIRSYGVQTYPHRTWTKGQKLYYFFLMFYGSMGVVCILLLNKEYICLFGK